ncbi:MAG: hypothetical protein QOC80_2144, partial [Frankiaceae bacterium]|nr:hypothetical protein [Frankiaceae bacterium]
MGAVLMMRVTAAWAASVALTSAHLGTGIVTPYLFPTSVSTTNNGNKAGKLQASDSVTLNFSEQIQASTLCSSASNSVTSQNLPGLTAQLVDN